MSSQRAEMKNGGLRVGGAIATKPPKPRRERELVRWMIDGGNIHMIK
jgi:hypothetical protein